MNDVVRAGLVRPNSESLQFIFGIPKNAAEEK